MVTKTTGKITGLALVGLLAAAPMSGGFAQSTTGAGQGTSPGATGGQRAGGDRPTAPVPGANSFTEGQARGRIQDTGFTDVTELRKDDQGIWRGRATRGGRQVGVALDYQGNIFADGVIVDASAGTGGATPANNPGSDANRGTAATGTGTTGTGTTGMNTGTVGTTGAGTPGATGTVGGAVDRTLGTNTTGTNPAANAPDGTPGNPPSTAVGRAIDRAQGQTPQPDGTPGNPAGTAAGRAVDRALGTNTTGTNPGGTNPGGTNPGGTTGTGTGTGNTTR